jgi:osmotically-inducible protein OsmY
VRVEAGVMALEGTVTTRWAKRLAEELAMVSGVRKVRNNLRVRGRGRA